MATSTYKLQTSAGPITFRTVQTDPGKISSSLQAAINAGNISGIKPGTRVSITGGLPGGAVSGGRAPVARTPVQTPVQQVIDIQRQFGAQAQQAIQPAISAYQASIPITQQRFAQAGQALAAQRSPIEQRYQSVLDEITRRERETIGEQQIATSREFGRRGIPLSSGVFETTLGEQLAPIRETYGGLTRDVGIEREATLSQLAQQLAELPLQEAQAILPINQAIANLQAQAAGGSIQSALQLYQLQQEAELARRRAASGGGIDPFQFLSQFMGGQPSVTTSQIPTAEDFVPTTPAPVSRTFSQNVAAAASPDRPLGKLLGVAEQVLGPVRSGISRYWDWLNPSWR